MNRYVRVFGNLSMAKLRADISSSNVVHLTDEQLEELEDEMIEDLQRCKEKYRKASVEGFKKKDTDIKVQHIRRHFGSFGKAKIAALDNPGELQKKDAEMERKEHRREIKDTLLDCQSEFGEVKTQLIEDNYDITLRQVRKWFDSWAAAKYQARISDAQTNRYRWEQSSKEELIDALEVCHERYGDVHRDSLRQDDSLPNPSMITSAFGSLSSAKLKADINNPAIALEVLNDEEFSEVREFKKKGVLKKLYHEYGMNQTAIAEELGCNQGSVSHYMKKYGIETRSGAEAKLCKNICVSERQHEILTGLLMSDGRASYCHSNETAVVQVDMVTEPFILWLKEQMGDVCCSVRQKETESENAQTLHRLSTRCLEEFTKYREWYSSGQKVWPEDIELTPLTLKMLFVGDGTVAKQRSGSKYIKIYLKNEHKNKDTIENMFERVGFEAKWHGYSVRFTLSESERMWEYMGSPPPGFEYKWP